MSRNDVYLIGVWIMQVFIFSQVVEMVVGGVVVSMMLEKGVMGYLTIALFAVVLLVLFNNLYRLANTTGAVLSTGGENTPTEISHAIHWSIIAFVLLISLYFLQSFSLVSMYDSH